MPARTDRGPLWWLGACALGAVQLAGIALAIAVPRYLASVDPVAKPIPAAIGYVDLPDDGGFTILTYTGPKRIRMSPQTLVRGGPGASMAELVPGRGVIAVGAEAADHAIDATLIIIGPAL